MHRLRYLIGLLILAATVVGAAVLWRLVRNTDERPGTQLRVEFRDARGLRGGADVRYRGVTVGTVRRVHVATDGGKAVADLLLDPATAVPLAVDSVFWIVSPRFTGLTTGASGLDTLVRDAYVAFLTPEEHGSPLAGGTLIAGSERPPLWQEPDTLEPVQHGDLLLSVLVPENHGLRAGSPVVFRGMTVGDVRSVELAGSGTHVEVRLRIAHDYRRTVTDKSVFWVARPGVQGALFSGFTVTDANALLSPYVNYYTEPAAGLPVEDGYRVAALAARPDLKIAEVPAKALTPTPRPHAASTDALAVVRVLYGAVLVHTLGSDDDIRREGSGVLFLDRSSRAAVVTARSLVDGAYTERGRLGSSPEIAKEQIKVMLAGGSVLRAGRVWVDPGGRDLAVLVLEGAPPDLSGTAAALCAFAPAPELRGALHAVRETGEPLPAQDLGAPPPAVASWRGAVIVQDDKAVGIYGQAAGRDATPALVPLALLPEDLRPAK